MNLGSEIIKLIEKERNSKVICYITGDRNGAGAQMGEDAVRIIYEHLLTFGKNVQKIDLFLYSRGGDVSVPWKIVSMMREFCDEFNVIIPYRANSAATLLSLGADNILMSKKAELGPVDPSLSSSSDLSTPPVNVSVEDIKSYLTFLRKRAGITDQVALSQNIAILTERMGPNILGQIERTDSHIRFVARQLLVNRSDKIEETKINSIIEILTEKIYHHGHGIARKEAKEMGLPIENPPEQLEKLIWDLYLIYEKHLNLLNPLFAETILNKKESEKVIIPQAIIESAEKLHIFESEILFERKRDMIPNLQMNIPLNLQLPDNLKLEDLESNHREILQNMINKANEEIPEKVYQSILAQMPEIDINTKLLNYNWKEK